LFDCSIFFENDGGFLRRLLDFHWLAGVYPCPNIIFEIFKGSRYGLIVWQTMLADILSFANWMAKEIAWLASGILIRSVSFLLVDSEFCDMDFSYPWIFIGFCRDFSLFKGPFCGSRFLLAFPMEGPDVVDDLACFANLGSCCSLLSALGV
jgi:hypothetical protein